MQEHQKRLIEEKEELENKIDKLNLFLNKIDQKIIKIDSLSGKGKEYILLEHQYAIMLKYLRILEKRIEFFQKETN